MNEDREIRLELTPDHEKLYRYLDTKADDAENPLINAERVAYEILRLCRTSERPPTCGIIARHVMTHPKYKKSQLTSVRFYRFQDWVNLVLRVSATLEQPNAKGRLAATWKMQPPR